MRQAMMKMAMAQLQMMAIIAPSESGHELGSHGFYEQQCVDLQASAQKYALQGQLQLLASIGQAPLVSQHFSPHPLSLQLILASYDIFPNIIIKHNHQSAILKSMRYDALQQLPQLLPALLLTRGDDLAEQPSFLQLQQRLSDLEGRQQLGDDVCQLAFLTENALELAHLLFVGVLGHLGLEVARDWKERWAEMAVFDDAFQGLEDVGLRLCIEWLNGSFELSLYLLPEFYLLVSGNFELSLFLFLFLLPLLLSLLFLLFFFELLLELWLVAGDWSQVALVGAVVDIVLVLRMIGREVAEVVFVGIRRRMIRLLVELLRVRLEVLKLLRLRLLGWLGLHGGVHLLHNWVVWMAHLHGNGKRMRASSRHLIGVLELLLARMHVGRVLWVVYLRKVVDWRQVHVGIVKLGLRLRQNCRRGLVFPCCWLLLLHWRSAFLVFLLLIVRRPVCSFSFLVVLGLGLDFLLLDLFPLLLWTVTEVLVILLRHSLKNNLSAGLLILLDWLSRTGMHFTLGLFPAVLCWFGWDVRSRLVVRQLSFLKLFLLRVVPHLIIIEAKSAINSVLGCDLQVFLTNSSTLGQ